MKYGSTGTPAASPSKSIDKGEPRAGFTLVETLVALSLLLAFAAAVGPVLSHARRILARGEGEVRAQLLLRSLLEARFDPSDPDYSVRQGESAGFRWRVAVRPFDAEGLYEPELGASGQTPQHPPLFTVSARVSWGHAGAVVTAETLRLGGMN
jgi:prepilin-type N-terminal cleavage/methylation domain-containing protein